MTHKIKMAIYKPKKNTKGPRVTAIRYGPRRPMRYTKTKVPRFDYPTTRNFPNTRRSLEAVGEPVGTSNTKIFQYATQDTYNTRTLYEVPLTNCARGTGVNERLRDVINCRGFNITVHLLSTSASILMCNFAVVAVKDPPGAAAVPVQDFFRSSGATDARALDFSTALAGIEFHRLPLNSDKFTVMKHDRFMLNLPTAGMDGFFAEKIYWVPLDRQLTYFGTGETECNDCIRLLFWFDNLTTASAVVPQIDRCTGYVLAKTYFRETPN